MNIMVVAPHPDDESIGCGGAISLHRARGDRVVTVFLTSGELGLGHLAPDEAWRIREREAEEAANVLGTSSPMFLRLPDWFVEERVDDASARLAVILAREAPGAIYLPHPRDSHPDHRAAWPIVVSALHRAASPQPTLWTYEVWTPLPEYDRVDDITPVMERKLRAIRCHRSQCAGVRYDRAARGLNQYRGITSARCRYAEVFQSTGSPQNASPGRTVGPAPGRAP